MGYCTEDYYDARATGASSRAIPFQEPHGSFLPPSPVLSFLPRPLAACFDSELLLEVHPYIMRWMSMAQRDAWHG